MDVVSKRVGSCFGFLLDGADGGTFWSLVIIVGRHFAALLLHNPLCEIDVA